MRSTLEQFVDFDRINNKKVTRLSVGAVEISSGQMIYFDSHKQKIGPEHIMASGALPPGFPAVEIDGKFYWDGGLANNSPIGYVLSNQDHPHVLCFMIHLFDSFGLNPATLDDVIKRKKDIEFSSRFSRMIHLYREVQTLKNSIHILSKYIPKKHKSNPDLKQCMARGSKSTICLVRFLCEQDESDLSTKDYEFSKKTIFERIANGYTDCKNAIKKSPWHKKIPLSEGIALHDMAPMKHMEIKNE